jgi:hypothetical protein
MFGSLVYGLWSLVFFGLCLIGSRAFGRFFGLLFLGSLLFALPPVKEPSLVYCFLVFALPPVKDCSSLPA